MKKLKKALTLLVSFILIFVSTTVPINAQTINEANVTTDNVEMLNDCDYAIFTEDYYIDFKLNDDGTIIMDSTDYNSLKSFADKESTVSKILDDKRNAKMLSDSLSNSSHFLNVNAESIVKNIGNIKGLKSLDDKVTITDPGDIATVMAISNFSKNITCVSKEYIEGAVYLTLKYSWNWDYAPLVTLSDIVSIVWSDSFDSDGGTLRFKYIAEGAKRIYDDDGSYSLDFDQTETKTLINLSGDSACSDSTAAVGYQKTFDIKRAFSIGLSEYSTIVHSGSFQVTIFKNPVPTSDKTVSVVGDYFHQTIAPKATLTLSPTGANLSAVAQIRYDKANPCTRTFTV